MKPSVNGSPAINAMASKGCRCRQDGGVSPLFPPAGLDVELARADVAHAVHRHPRLLGVDRSSWTQAALRSVIGWMSRLSLAGVCKCLRRFGLHYKRGRQHVQLLPV